MTNAIFPSLEANQVLVGIIVAAVGLVWGTIGSAYGLWERRKRLLNEKQYLKTPRQECLQLLLYAYRESKELGNHPTDFAVTREDLRDSGWTDVLAQSLGSRGHIEHVRAHGRPGIEGRDFTMMARRGPYFDESCFYLTDEGAEQVEKEVEE